MNRLDKNKLQEEMFKNEEEIVLLSLQKRCVVPIKAEVRPLPSIVKSNVYNPNQYRCKSSEAQRNPRLMQRMNSPK